MERWLRWSLSYGELEQAQLHDRVEDHVPGMSAAHGLHEGGALGVFGQAAAGAGPQCTEDRLVVVARGICSCRIDRAQREARAELDCEAPRQQEHGDDGVAHIRGSIHLHRPTGAR